jgi:hypothetical protein
MLRGNKVSIVTDRCLAQATCTEFGTLENIYVMLVKSKILYGAKNLEIYAIWKQIHMIHGILF